MAFLIRVSMVSTFIVLVMFLLNHQPSAFVRADDELVRKVCHNSDAPTACNQCVKADNRSENADVVGIASIVVDCVKVQADNLQKNISKLASTSKDVAANRTFTQCLECLSYAMLSLNEATQGLKNGDYDASDKSVFNAYLNQTSCKYEFMENQINIPTQIYFGFNMFEELSQIALRIINRL